VERTTVLTAESHLLRGESAAEPLGRVTGGTVQLADGRTVAADEDLVRLLNVLLSSGLAHRRAQLVVDSEYVSAQTAAVMLGVSRPTGYKWQDNGLLGLEQVGNRRRVPREDIDALLLARQIRSASDEVLTDETLTAPLTESEYRAAAFAARRQGGSEAAAALRRAQRAALARASSASASQPDE
jgi:excisionase family DNA binding protein